MPNHPKYIDPLVDFAFKKIFGSEPNKDLLIAFLNEVLRGRKHIVDLVYNKNDHPGAINDEGGAIFDLLCTGDTGDHFLIEVQRGKQDHFKERALFYTSRLISDQAPKGKRSDWGYALTDVYLVAILEDFTLDNNKSGDYLHDISLCNTRTGEIFYNRLGFTYIELRNFVKADVELETDLDKWLYLLKHLGSLSEVPNSLHETPFEKLLHIAEYTNLTKEERIMYDSSLKYKWDNKNVLDYAVKEAVKEAIEITQKEAEIRKKAEMLEIAMELLKEGSSIEFISRVTKLPIEEVQKLVP